MKTNSAATQIAPTGIDEERVQQRRDSREPGPDVGDHLDERGPQPEEERVLVRPLHQAVTPRIHIPTPALVPITVERISCPLT